MNLAEVSYAVIESPIGRLLATGDGAALCGLYMESHKRGPAPNDRWAWSLTWLSTILLRISPLPSWFRRTTAAAVSSQDVSMPKIVE